MATSSSVAGGSGSNQVIDEDENSRCGRQAQQILSSRRLILTNFAREQRRFEGRNGWGFSDWEDKLNGQVCGRNI
jgi:hypothetical protein